MNKIEDQNDDPTEVGPNVTHRENLKPLCKVCIERVNVSSSHMLHISIMA